MKKLITLLLVLACVSAQAPVSIIHGPSVPGLGGATGGGGGGGALTVVSTDGQSNATGPTTHSLTSVPAGALLVVSTQNESDSGNATVTSTPTLTWTKRVDAQSAGSGNAEIWTAVSAAGGTISVTSSWGTSHESSACYVITGQESVLGGATATAIGQSAPSVTITTTRANSLLILVNSDWFGTAGVATYRDSPIVSVFVYSSPPQTRAEHWYKQASGVASHTLGETNPTGQSAGIAVLEIRTP